MAVARKCDVCGILYESYNVGNNSEKVNSLRFLNVDDKNLYFAHNIIDCCPECIDAIKKVIEDRKPL